MRNKISLVELKVRVKDFKKEILMIKNQEIRIWYQPEIVNRISFMGSREYSNLIHSLEIFGKMLKENDEIKKFKELLDMGAITQEEFDAKKKELLGL